MQRNSMLVKCFLSSFVAIAVCACAMIAPLGNVNAQEPLGKPSVQNVLDEGETWQSGGGDSEGSGESVEKRFDGFEIVEFRVISYDERPHLPEEDNASDQQSDLPIVIHEQDGTTWTKTDEVVSPDGSISHVYTDNSNVQFEDGGLGDAELIIN